ncbi:MAG: sodium:proton antiporter [Pseudolabrys sp.]|nr:sodium:proton antiporter [Pseudolabrys sp.]
MRIPKAAFAAPLALLIPTAAQAAPALDGAQMTWPWALPFAGILLSIALGPLLIPKIWHHHYGKIATGWVLLTLAALAVRFGVPTALAAFVHAALAEYMSFIILLFALYVVAGGILVTGTLRGTPATNLAILAFGTAIASVVGTTGASMILIRPLIRANAGRSSNAHVVVFFIFLVANIGGALSPLGDPPLFVGFLRGVDFFWTAQHLWLQTAIVAVLVLAIFFALDTFKFRAEPPVPAGPTVAIAIRGRRNIVLIGLTIAAILLSATWQPGVVFDIYSTKVALQNLLRDAALILIAFASLWLTPDEHRAANGFSFEPIREVAILFAGIFVAIIPVLAMLQAGPDGTFAFLLQAVTAKDGTPHEAAYFWLTGALSGFLDNAPTYLVFFELASGEARELMGPLSGTLAAISMGAVYMGALSYIGNAPNLMIYAIASDQGVRMPSFFAYVLWAVCVLVPLFLILTLLPISPILKLS